MLGVEATELLKDEVRAEESKTVPIKIAANDILSKHTEYIFNYVLETWYPIQQLQRHTPRSVFLEVTDSELVALFAACKRYQQKGLKVDKFNSLDDLELATEEKELLEGLAARIDESIESYFLQKKVFVKLSTRSPKDALTDEVNERFKVYLDEELDRNMKESLNKNGLESQNLDSIAVCIAKRKCMKIKSGQEALNILILSSRVREDLMKSYDCNWKFSLKVILREWFDFKPEQEFRIFVKDRQLTAVTQYCYFQYFKQVVQYKEGISQAIQNFFDKEVKSFLLNDHQNCVIDICVVWDESDGTIEKIFIIEINPFFPDTSGCLFNWRSGVDGLILRGKSPFEMRVVDKINSYPLSCYSPDWVDYINAYRGRKVGRNNNNKVTTSSSDIHGEDEPDEETEHGGKQQSSSLMTNCILS